VHAAVPVAPAVGRRAVLVRAGVELAHAAAGDLLGAESVSRFL
jgi:hypothetical protein